jgi:hypothetical protein
MRLTACAALLLPAVQTHNLFRPATSDCSDRRGTLNQARRAKTSLSVFDGRITDAAFSESGWK